MGRNHGGGSADVAGYVMMDMIIALDMMFLPMMVAHVMRAQAPSLVLIFLYSFFQYVSVFHVCEKGHPRGVTVWLSLLMAIKNRLNRH